MNGDGFTFDADRAGETTVVVLAGELDMAATFRIEPELERLTRDTGVGTLVIDMDGVAFMDSSALGLLLATQQRLQADGIRLIVANPSESVRRILELTGAGDSLAVTSWPQGA
jgi:anti-sigma B factor antagonist